MEKFGKSQSILRTEDNRFLTGKGRYIDDSTPSSSLHAYFFRSQVAHAKITNLNIEDAKKASGVYGIFKAADLENNGVKNDLVGVTVKNRDGTNGACPKRPLLAKDRVRFVGEPIVLVVADSIPNAKDAAELIEIDYADLPVSTELTIGENTIHPEAPGNVAFEWDLGDKSKTDVVFEQVEKVVSMEVYNNRIIANSMEPRGCYAQWNDERLHLSFSGQGVWVHKRFASEILGLRSEQIRVTNPDVGGGFGLKIHLGEGAIITWASRKVGCPVKWTATRQESFLSDSQARDHFTKARMAFDKEGKIIGITSATHTYLNVLG